MDPIAPLPDIPEDELDEEALSAREAQKLDVDLNSTIAAVSYLYPLSVIALVTRRDSRFVQFHARQGTVLFCASLIALVLPFWLRVLSEFLLFLVIAYGFVQASQGKWLHIPGVAAILEGRSANGRAMQAANAAFLRATAAVRLMLRKYRKGPADAEPVVTLDPPDVDRGS